MQELNHNKAKPVYFKLWFWVLFAMISGIIFGAIFSNVAVETKFAIDLFIKAIKLLVGPIIFLTVVSGIIGMGNLKKLGSIGLKTIIYFEIVSTFALLIGMLSAHLFKPGSGMNLDVATMDVSSIASYTAHSNETQIYHKYYLKLFQQIQLLLL